MSHPGFHNKIEVDGKYPPEKGRYVLYTSLVCPYAQRAMILHALKGLEDVIQVVHVHPIMAPIDASKGIRVWPFGGFNDTERPAGVETALAAFADKDITTLPQSVQQYLHNINNRNTTVNGINVTDTVLNKRNMKEIYDLSDNTYDGRWTVPVLFDTKTNTIVTNESAEIIAIFNSAFDSFATNPSFTMYPESIPRDELEANYTKTNNELINKSYGAGFASNQLDYLTAIDSVYNHLDYLEELLQKQRFAAGNDFSEADVRLIVALLRFDPVSNRYFKCTKKRLAEYPIISEYVRDIYQNVFNDAARATWSEYFATLSIGFTYGADGNKNGLVLATEPIDFNTPIVDRSNKFKQ